MVVPRPQSQGLALHQAPQCLSHCTKYDLNSSQKYSWASDFSVANSSVLITYQLFFILLQFNF